MRTIFQNEKRKKRHEFTLKKNEPSSGEFKEIT